MRHRKLFGLVLGIVLLLVLGSMGAAWAAGVTPTKESKGLSYTAWEIIPDGETNAIAKPLVPKNAVAQLFFEDGETIYAGDTIARFTLDVQNINPRLSYGVVFTKMVVGLEGNSYPAIDVWVYDINVKRYNEWEPPIIGPLKTEHYTVIVKVNYDANPSAFKGLQLLMRPAEPVAESG